MKIISITLLIFLSCASFFAQDKKESSVFLDDYDKDCGNPFVLSALYATRKGKVIKIINGNTILVAVSDEDNSELTVDFKVILAGVKASSKDSGKLLNERVLNREVEIVGNLKIDSDRKLFGIVFVPERLADLNWYLLRYGFGKYEKPKYKSSVPAYTLCQYRKTEAKARQEKSGIWAK